MANRRSHHWQTTGPMLVAKLQFRWPLTAGKRQLRRDPSNSTAISNGSANPAAFFVTTIEFATTLQAQRDDAHKKGQIRRQQIFDGLLDRLDQTAT